MFLFPLLLIHADRLRLQKKHFLSLENKLPEQERRAISCYRLLSPKVGRIDYGSYSERAFIDKNALLSLKFYNIRDIKYSMLALTSL